MTFPAIIMWVIVFAVGIPASIRNPTAAALVMSWMAGEATWLITGNSLPLQSYACLDIFVLAVIMAKKEYCNLQPYRDTWHQLKCILLERSPADRIVMVIFGLCWLLYVADLHPYYKWYALWGLVILQFLASGWESFFPFLRASKANDSPSSSDGLSRLAWGRTGYG